MFANILSGLKKNEKNKKTKKNKGKEAETNERSSESFVERIEIAEERSPLPSSYENSHSFEGIKDLKFIYYIIFIKIFFNLRASIWKNY